jgi:hypothetical protein
MSETSETLDLMREAFKNSLPPTEATLYRSAREYMDEARMELLLAELSDYGDAAMFLGQVKFRLANRVMEAGDVAAWWVLADLQDQLWTELRLERSRRETREIVERALCGRSCPNEPSN